MQFFEMPLRIHLDECEIDALLGLPSLLCFVEEKSSMLEGILVVNLDPPYVGFVKKHGNQSGDDKRMHGSLRNCSLPELRQMLIELGAISPQQQWPPRDYMIRLPGSFSEATLAKIGLDTGSSSGLGS